MVCPILAHLHFTWTVEAFLIHSVFLSSYISYRYEDIALHGENVKM